MESPNLHHQQQLQDLQLLGLSSSSYSLDTEASCYGTQIWSPIVSLNNNNFNNGHNNALFQQHLSLQWQHQSLAKVKEELSSSSSSSSSDRHSRDLNDLSEKLLLKTVSSSGFPIMNNKYFDSPQRGSFSQIYSSINISSLNPNKIPRSIDMNLQTLDNRLMNSVSQQTNLGKLYKDGIPFGLGDHHHLLQQQSLLRNHQQPSCSPSDQMSNLGTSKNEHSSTEAKRPSSLQQVSDSKGAAAAGIASKKPRVEPRASFPPLKVRKEKLGDRIAALQQLVAPFGKTDTASVLMEAIGYIKFLQDQVETLSVPYMRSSRNRIGKSTPGGSMAEEGHEEVKRDLRSRGLCLVPLSCMSYVTGESVVGGGGGGFWPPPPGFGGGT